MCGPVLEAIVSGKVLLRRMAVSCERERGGELVGGGVGIRPVDIAIGDGKNVSVNVTALSVPFSP